MSGVTTPIFCGSWRLHPGVHGVNEPRRAATGTSAAPPPPLKIKPLVLGPSERRKKTRATQKNTAEAHQSQTFLTRSSSREVRRRVPDFSSVVYFSRGTPPPKKGERATLGDLVKIDGCGAWGTKPYLNLRKPSISNQTHRSKQHLWYQSCIPLSV